MFQWGSIARCLERGFMVCLWGLTWPLVVGGSQTHLVTDCVNGIICAMVCHGAFREGGGRGLRRSTEGL